MKNIPNISFESNEVSDFELLDLKNLFARIPIESHNPTHPHRITFFALLIVTNGIGTHQIDLKEYPLQKGTLLKIAKGQVHTFQNHPKYEGYLILFTEDFILNYFSKSTINIISHLYNYHISSPVIEDEKANELLLIQLIEELQAKNTYAQKNIIAALLELYLLKQERNSRTVQIQINNSKQYHIFLQFKNLVESNFTTSRNVKYYASLLYISTKYLNQIVNKFTISTAKSFIDNYVMLEAKREIVSTDKSLKEIAYNIGFDEVTNFTKFFKKHLNTTPKEFRLKHNS